MSSLHIYAENVIFKKYIHGADHEDTDVDDVDRSRDNLYAHVVGDDRDNLSAHVVGDDRNDLSALVVGDDRDYLSAHVVENDHAHQSFSQYPILGQTFSLVGVVVVVDACVP